MVLQIDSLVVKACVHVCSGLTRVLSQGWKT